MNDKNTKISSLIPEDVRSLGRVYGFSVEGYVNFEAQRVRETTLETTPLMKANRTMSYGAYVVLEGD